MGRTWLPTVSALILGTGLVITMTWSQGFWTWILFDFLMDLALALAFFGGFVYGIEDEIQKEEEK